MTPEQQKPLTRRRRRRDRRSATARRVVFVVRDGVATAVPVTPGAKLGDLIAIVGEVKSGEKAVLKPASRRS